MTDHHSLQPVFAADQAQPVRDASLVLSAIDIDHDVQQLEGRWVLLVDPADQPRAHQQLLAYWAENKPANDQPVTPTLVDSGWFGVIGYLFVIWLIPAAQGFVSIDLKEPGLLQAGLVMEGQWWRAITALTLHSDIAHIAGNSLFGTVFGLFVGRYLGSGVGWLLVLLCGFVANLVNASIEPEQFRALGASTATFAALGLVPAFGWRRGYFRGRGFKRGFAPLFAAIALLAFTGFGSENVDVLGHVFGFIAGISAGLACAHMQLDRIKLADQQRAGAFALILVAVAWLFALS